LKSLGFPLPYLRLTHAPAPPPATMRSTPVRPRFPHARDRFTLLACFLLGLLVIAAPRLGRAQTADAGAPGYHPWPGKQAWPPRAGKALNASGAIQDAGTDAMPYAAPLQAPPPHPWRRT
jgi:hypothetical protein